MQCKMATRKKKTREKKNNQVKNGAKPFEKRAQKNVISPYVAIYWNLYGQWM